MMATQIPRKRKWGDIATVTLIVGESKRIFQVHEAKLFETSSYFRLAFTSQFREATERSMTLPEDDEETFEDFVEWLYSGKFEISPHPPNGIFTAALKLFVLADKYRVFELKNIITKQIFILGKNMQKPPSLTELSYAYEHTVQHSGIRKLLTDWQTWNIDLIWFERPDVQAFLRQHPDCATDLCVGLAKKFKKTMIHEAYDPFLADMPEAYKDKDKEQEKMSTPQPIGGAFARNGRPG